MRIRHKFAANGGKCMTHVAYEGPTTIFLISHFHIAWPLLWKSNAKRAVTGRGHPGMEVVFYRHFVVFDDCYSCWPTGSEMWEVMKRKRGSGKNCPSLITWYSIVQSWAIMVVLLLVIGHICASGDQHNMKMRQQPCWYIGHEEHGHGTKYNGIRL